MLLSPLFNANDKFNLFEMSFYNVHRHAIPILFAKMIRIMNGRKNANLWTWCNSHSLGGGVPNYSDDVALLLLQSRHRSWFSQCSTGSACTCRIGAESNISVKDLLEVVFVTFVAASHRFSCVFTSL